ncbi:MAG: GNAT family N-acetyltransferase [Hyphomicrobiaceae bacterium]
MPEIVCLNNWSHGCETPVDWATTTPTSAFESELRICHLPSLAHVTAQEWDNLFPGLSEGWQYFKACENTAPDNFELSALAVYRAGRLVGGVLMFETQYRLDMTLGEGFRGLRDWLARTVPGVVSVRIAGLGSPMSEECPIGLDAGLSKSEKDCVFEKLISGFEKFAATKGIKVLALKDVTDRDGQRFSPNLKARGFARMASLPIATLPLPFENLDNYLASLRPNMRKDIRRKLNQSKNVAVEIVDCIEDLEEEIISLYRATQQSRKANYEGFDEVPDSYFGEVMRQMGGKARVLLMRVEGRLVGFSLFLEEEDRVIAKFIGLDYKFARRHNLYFVNWLESVRYCLERSISMMQVGQTTYQLKSRMGCQLKRSWIYFKHTGSVFGPVFRAIGPHMALDQSNSELRAMADDAPYLSAAA